MNSVKRRIEEKLELAFAPDLLEVTDESHLHRGHVGARPQGESHFRVVIASAAFNGQNRVQRHRAVYVVLAEELDTGVHALSLHIQGVA
jgi:BolA protein